MRISATDGPARRSTSLRCRVAPPEVRSSVLDIGCFVHRHGIKMCNVSLASRILGVLDHIYEMAVIRKLDALAFAIPPLSRQRGYTTTESPFLRFRLRISNG